MQSKVAFITGITGQDGAYLADFLVDKGYEVHGLVRWDSYVDPINGMARLGDLGLINDRITLHTGDLTDAQNITALINHIRPDEIYNLAALSHVKASFETPASTFDINAKGSLHILEAVRLLGLEKSIKIYQASSSEMFGSSPAPQNENTPMQPCSPYGVAKLSAYWLAKTYRDAYGMFVANGILFNHESSMRGEDFVTAKIARAVVEFEQGRQTPLSLGNLDSMRDWGHAKDYVRGIWMMLQQDKSDDYVLATGKSFSVRQFAECAFEYIGQPLTWLGSEVNEIAINARSGKTLVKIDEKLFRPKEVNYLLGDASKAHDILGWKAEIGFEELVRDMVNARRILKNAAPYSNQKLCG